MLIDKDIKGIKVVSNKVLEAAKLKIELCEKLLEVKDYSKFLGDIKPLVYESTALCFGALVSFSIEASLETDLFKLFGLLPCDCRWTEWYSVLSSNIDLINLWGDRKAALTGDYDLKDKYFVEAILYSLRNLVHYYSTTGDVSNDEFKEYILSLMKEVGLEVGESFKDLLPKYLQEFDRCTLTCLVKIASKKGIEFIPHNEFAPF